MSDEPWRDGDPEEAYKELFAAARREPAPLRLQATLLAGLTVGAIGGTSAVASAAQVAAHSGKALALSAAKWLAIGAMAGSAATVAGAEISARLSSAPSKSEPSGEVRAARPATRPQPAPLRGTVAATVADEPAPSAAVALPAPAIVAQPGPSTEAPVEEASTASDGAQLSMRDEVQLLERARTELGRGRAAAALAALERYARLAPRGRLSAEAAALRVDALVVAGDSERARVAAERFLQAHPQSPIAERMRKIATRSR